MLTALIDLTLLGSENRLRGIGRYAAELARALASRSAEGLAVRAIASLPWLGRPQISDDLSGTVERLTAPAAPMRRQLEWAYALRLRLASAARLGRPDVLHCPHPEATPLGDLRCPRVVTCHDVLHGELCARYASWREGWSWGRHRLDRRRYRSADHVIAISQATADDLMRTHGVAASRITVVHHGVDAARWSPEAAPGDGQVLLRQGLSAGGYLLYVGGADWRKNAEGMVRALAVARKRRPSLEVSLAWAGSLRPAERRRVIALAREHGVFSAVKLLGFVGDADLAALYRGALCELFISRWEGFGYPIVEGMAAGCPVITSRVSCMPEIAGDAAIQLDPEDHEAIAGAVVTLADDSHERARLVAAGLGRAKRFTLTRAADETLAVYARVATGKAK